MPIQELLRAPRDTFMKRHKADVLSTKRAASSRMENHQRLRSLIDLNPDGVCAIDCSGSILEANAACSQIFGIPLENLVQMRWMPAVIDDCTEQVYHHARQAIDGESQRYECTIRHRDGQLVDLSIVNIPMIVSERVVGFYALVRDVTERRRADTVLRFLSQVDQTLASSLDERAVLTTVAQVASRAIADYCSIVLVDEHGRSEWIVSAGARSPDDSTQAPQSRPLTSEPLPEEVSRVLRTGRTEVHVVLSAPLRALFGSDPEAPLPEITSTVIAPLSARGTIFGTLVFATESGRAPATGGDAALAVELAGRVALAVDNARQYRQRSEIAHTLQQSLLPPALPQIPEIEWAAGYSAGGLGLTVGGDFYDAFQVAEGNWVVLIGDVTGKGPLAASFTAMIRHTARALATRVDCPAEMLSELNEAVLPQIAEDRFCTISILRLQRSESGLVARIANGGHPLPLLLRPNGSVREVGCCGPLVGAISNLTWAAQSVELEAGDTLLLYTDGVSEARSPYGEFFGEERLMALLRSCASMTAHEIVIGIKEVVVQFQQGRPRDDLALLAVRPLSGGATTKGITTDDPVPSGNFGYKRARVDR